MFPAVERAISVDLNQSAAAPSDALVVRSAHALPTPGTGPDLWTIALGLGFVIGIGRYAIVVWTVSRWVRRGRLFELDVDDATVILSRDAGAPMAVWLGRHIILLPIQSENWPEERRRSVLAHELAHVRRGDWLSKFIARLVWAMFWPNPLVWLLCRYESELAERSADDFVLTSGVAASRYAHDLLEIAREARATAPVPAVPMVYRTAVARRIDMILRTRINRGSLSLPGVLTCALVTIVLAAPISDMAIVRRLDKPAGGSQAAPFGNPTKIILKICFVNPGARITKAMEPRRFPDGTVGVISAFDAKEVEAVQKLWNVDGGVVTNAPIIRTISGAAATVTQGNETAGSKLDVTPTLLDDGQIELALEFSSTQDGASTDQVIKTREKQGMAFAIFAEGKHGLRGDLICIVTPVVESDGAP